jgi:hypothetical protein
LSRLHGLKRFSCLSPLTHIEGPSVRNIAGYADEALRFGRVTSPRPGVNMIEYDLGRTVGYGPTGSASSSIRMYVEDGVIQTIFPF